MSLFLQDYIKLRRIGEGAFASIWKVQHKSLGYVRAIKVLNATIEDEHDDAYQTFLKECRVLLQLGNGCHPHIMRVYQPRLVDNRALVEMDYVEGRTMTEVLKETPFLPIDEVYRFIREIGSALAYCHVDIYRFMMNPAEDHLELDPHNARQYLISPEKEQELIRKYGITHNDLHSNNVMRRDYDGSYVLLDFGLAIQDKQCVKSSSQRDGAPEYKAPEKWESADITPRTDVYSWGVMMYEALAGRPPFVCDVKAAKSREEAIYKVSKDHLETPPPPIFPFRQTAFEKMYPGQTYEQDYPEELEQVILKCLAKHPEDRYANVKEVLTSLPLGGGQEGAALSPQLAAALAENHRLKQEIEDLQQTIRNLAASIGGSQTANSSPAPAPAPPPTPQLSGVLFE